MPSRKSQWHRGKDGSWYEGYDPENLPWDEDAIEAAKRGLSEDDDIPRDDPNESEPYMTESEKKKREK
jgi:hypothetical protein